MNIVRKRMFESGIGPNTDEEATAIHKGMYDAMAIWRPDKFIKTLMDVRDNNFEDFEDEERQYYYSVFVTFFLLKYIGVLTALKFFPAVAAYL